jgi:hypothetical protein
VRGFPVLHGVGGWCGGGRRGLQGESEWWKDGLMLVELAAG